MNHITRLALVATSGLWLLGCAAPTAKTQTHPKAAEANLAVYRERASKPAAALVFSPPLIQDAPPLELARDDRQPSAFMGYPEAVTEFFYLRWDDSQVGGAGTWGSGFNSGGSGFGWGDRYERRAISEKVGVLYR